MDVSLCRDNVTSNTSQKRRTYNQQKYNHGNSKDIVVIKYTYRCAQPIQKIHNLGDKMK